MVAASDASDDVDSSWKLDNSSTHAAAGTPRDSRCASTSSTAGLILPATSASRPAARHMAPVSAVTVDLPLVPVMARTRGLPAAPIEDNARAKSSTSPTTSVPDAKARCTCGVARDIPGLMASMSMPSKLASCQPPRCTSASGTASRNSTRPGAASRESATRTLAPRPASHFAIDNPVSPNPSTKTLFPFKFTLNPPRHHCRKPAMILINFDIRSLPSLDRAFNYYQRSFKVDKPNNTSIMLMIQNRTTTCDSFHPPSS